MKPWVRLLKYADGVRRIQDATGATAEDSSKLIQILDDEKVSYEQLEKVVAKSGKTYDFTIEGLARMSDEFLTLTDEQEKAKFMNERFGKQWISFVPMMEKGGDAIRDAADAVSDKLVLDQQAVDQARELERATDDWNDAIQGVKLELGTGLLPVLVDLIEWSNAYNKAQDEQIKGWERLFPPIAIIHGAILAFNQDEKAAVTVTDEHTNALDENAASAEANAAAIKEISAAHKDMLSLIGNVASAEQSYQENAKSLTDERIQIEQERAAAITAGWWEGSEKIKDFDAALEENGAKAEENAAKHHEAMGKIQYDLLLAKWSVDGLTDAEFQMSLQAGLTFGVFDVASITAAQNMNAVADAVTNGTMRVEDMDAALQMMSKGYSIDVVMNVIAKMANANAFLGGAHTTVTQQTQQGGYAAGGVATGPSSGHWELLHGDEAVIPLQNGSVPVQMMGGGSSVAGGDNIYINLTIASPLTILDEQKAQTMLLPFIVQGIRQAKSQGSIR